MEKAVESLCILCRELFGIFFGLRKLCIYYGSFFSLILLKIDSLMGWDTKSPRVMILSDTSRCYIQNNYHGFFWTGKWNGQSRQTVSYISEHVVGTGSYGMVFQEKYRETGEVVAIKKVLQDKRYKNRELQIMQMLDHLNVVALKHSFFSRTDNEEVDLNIVLEFVPETVNRVAIVLNLSWLLCIFQCILLLVFYIMISMTTKN